MSKKVFFYLCPRETATKVHNFTNENGQSLNKTKVSHKVGNIYRPLLSASTGKLVTGLEKMVDNPYKELSKEEIKSNFEPYILGKEKIKLQHLLEYKHGRTPNYYDSSPTKLVPVNADEISQIGYMQHKDTFRKITDKGLVLDLSKPEDEVAYYYLTAKATCAPSRDKTLKGIHEFYIGFENEDAERTYSKAQIVDKAIYALQNPELTDEVKLKISKVLGIVTRDAAPQRVYTTLRNFIVDKDKDQAEKIARFLDIMNGLDDKNYRERFNAEALLSDLVAYFVVNMKSGTYNWKSNNLVIGYNKTEAVNFLLDPHKQGEVEQLELQLSAKKNS